MGGVKQPEMPQNARRLLTILYVMSGGMDGVEVDLEAHGEAIRSAFRMSEDEFERLWGEPQSAIYANKLRLRGESL